LNSLFLENFYAGGAMKTKIYTVNKMTFYEYMQTQLTRKDLIGSIAASMSIDVKLFPSMRLKELTWDEWQQRICNKAEIGKDFIMAAFDEAAKEYKVQNEIA
jgi:hypothetical protein